MLFGLKHRGDAYEERDPWNDRTSCNIEHAVRTVKSGVASDDGLVRHRQGGYSMLAPAGCGEEFDA